MDKQLIANDLLPVYQTTDTGERVIDARELHGFLNVGRDFTNWLKDRIEKFGFIEGEDFSPLLAKTSENGGRPRTDYILKLDMAKELAMVENNEQGRKARKYFIEVEKRYRGQVPTVPIQEQPLLPEFDRINRLLQMIRLGERERLFNEATSQALRTQAAEMVLGRPIQTAGDRVVPIEESSRGKGGTDSRPQWVRDGYGAKAIGHLAKCSATKVGVWAKKYGLQSEAYGGWYEYVSNGRTFRVFIYNEAGKDILLGLLSGTKTDIREERE